MKSNTKKYADELMADPHSKMKLLVLTKPDTPQDVARRAGYSSPEEMEEALVYYQRRKTMRRKRLEDRAAADHIRRKKAPIIKREEMEKLLETQSTHGDRVRAAIGNRQLGKQVAAENEKNTRRILELKKEIKESERY